MTIFNFFYVKMKNYQKLCLNHFQIVTTLTIFYEKHMQKRHQGIQSHLKDCRKRLPPKLIEVFRFSGPDLCQVGPWE